MDRENLISITEICTWHHVENSFIHSLSEVGLVEITRMEDQEFLEKEQLRELEKMIRLHNELQINLEGIDAIYHLLGRVSDLQEEVRMLRNRLRRYED